MNLYKRILCIFIAVIIILSMLFSLVLSAIPVFGAELPAPQNFKAEINGTYVKISWENLDTGTSYYYTVIEKSTDHGEFVPIASLYKGRTSYNDYSISNGHIYTYRARVVYTTRFSAYTREEQVIVYYPTGLSVSQTYSSQVDLKWSYPNLPAVKPPEYDLLVERKKYGTNRWETVAQLTVSDNSWSDKNVEPDTLYYYRIKVRYPNGRYTNNIPHSVGVSTRTGFPLNTQLTGYALSSNRIRLEWDMTNNFEGTAVLQRMDAAGNYRTIFSSSLANTYTDSGLLSGETYTYRLYMRSKNGQHSEYTEEISISTEVVPWPWNLSAKALPSERVILTWQYPYEVETGFEVWRKSTGSWEKIGVVGRNIHDFSDTDIESGQSYTYKIRAIRGDTAFSAFSQTAYVDYTYPATPPMPIFYTYNNMLFLYSKDVVPENTTYTLEYREGINDEWTDFKTVSQSYLSAILTFSPDTEFQFRIRANNESLASYSPQLDFYGSSPEAPEDFQVQIIGFSQVLLTWNHPGKKTDGYYIYRIADDGSKKLLGMTESSERSFIDTTPVAGSSSEYAITAFNTAGESEIKIIKVNVPEIKAFKDVEPVKWAQDAIYGLLGKGAFEYGDGYFRPLTAITKGEAVRWVLRTFDIPYDMSGLFTPTDISPVNPYYKDLITAVNLGIIHPDGFDRVFPGKVMTRRDMVLLLNNALNYLDIPLDSATDDVIEKFDDYYEIAAAERHIIASFAGSGIISGDGKKLNLSDNATRAEAAVLTYRIIRRYLRYR